ncbi:CLOCK-interacting pacemaker [Chanos chanos]|uniref:CLOCK-interacting pacemaker n=1 Tax=Chanos chanos TaxID=29144 RepID=A0A6J2VCE0_CHACN|nr:CLOCK-interacting pacemaker-like [Chanos chanos]
MSLNTEESDPLRSVSKQRIRRMEKGKQDSERDSGFSDASSEHLSPAVQQEREDESHAVVPDVTTSRSQSQLAVVGGSFPSLSPMIIMNNVLLKQPGDNPPSLKPWGFSPAVKVLQQPQVVFLQPLVSQSTAAVPKGPPPKRRRHKKYLPILKSYPKIAPHPGDSPVRSSSSSSCTTSSVKSSSSSLSGRERHHRDKQHCSQPSSSSGTTIASLMTPPTSLPASPLPPTTPTETTSSNHPLGDRPVVTSRQDLHVAINSALLNHNDDILKAQSDGNHDSTDGSDCSNKRKRFCNTYNILSKSGLLDITLRTKELIRQNRRTQSELDRLREHTDLFLEALQSGDSQLWTKLQKSMQEEEKERETEKNGRN